MSQLLMRYIRLALEEARLARVPQQLISPDSDESDSKTEIGKDENVNEFSGVGAIVGYSAPLGVDPDQLGRQKNRGRRKNKKL